MREALKYLTKISNKRIILVKLKGFCLVLAEHTDPGFSYYNKSELGDYTNLDQKF